MILPSSFIKETEIGFGVFTPRRVVPGMVVWLPCTNCKRYDRAQLEQMDQDSVEDMDEYGFRAVNGDIIMPCQHTYLLNHSCEPNVLDFGLDFGIAIKEILPGEQFKIDYSTFYEDDEWSFECQCGTPSCRKIITATKEEMEKSKSSHIDSILNAVRRMRSVEQPLHDVLKESSSQYVELMNTEPSEIQVDMLTGGVLR